LTTISKVARLVRLLATLFVFLAATAWAGIVASESFHGCLIVRHHLAENNVALWNLSSVDTWHKKSGT